MVERGCTAALRLGANVLAPAGARARLSTLIFHRVMEQPDPLRPGEPTVAEFARLLRWVKSWFNVLPLAEAVQRAQRGNLPSRPLAITFDDGYADNRLLALPVLRDLGLPATVFVATGHLDGGRMFNDTVIEAVRRTTRPTLDASALGLGALPIGTIDQKRAAIDAILSAVKPLPLVERSAMIERVLRSDRLRLPTDLMMTTAQVRELHAAGIEIGAHTVNHPILASLDAESALAEISKGRSDLESIIGGRVRLFAYPNGRPGRDFRSEHVEMVRTLGFEAAVTTAHGVADRGCDPFRIPRFTPWRKRPLGFALQMLGNLASPVHAS